MPIPTVDIPELDVCNSLDAMYKEQLAMLDTLEKTLTAPLDDFKNKILDAVPIGDAQAVAGKVGEMTGAANAAKNSMVNASNGMAGSCLDSINGKISRFLGTLSSAASNIVGAVKDSIFDAVGSLFEFDGSLGNLNFPNLLGSLDQLLGCLASSSCLPTDELQAGMDKIEAFLDKFGLDDSGEFSLDKYYEKLKNEGTEISTAVQNNFTSVSESATALTTEIQTSLKTETKSETNLQGTWI